MKYAINEASRTFKRILLATDFSSAGQVAFRAAMQLCRCSGASLHILNIFEYASLTPSDCGEQLLELDTFYQDAERSMENLVQEARRGGISCEGTIRRGISHIAILKSVMSENVGLVVLGTRAIHDFERLVFGSTAEAVLRKAACPVYTVGPQAASQECQVAPANRTVVFATDFHDTTTEALRDAAAFAQLSRLPLHCLHVLPRSAEHGTHDGVVQLIITEALQHLADRLDHAPPSLFCTVTYGSEISNAIIEYARQNNAILIVLGVRRASLAVAHVPAHIAYRIITEASCPVLTRAFPLEAPETGTSSDSVKQAANLPVPPRSRVRMMFLSRE